MQLLSLALVVATALAAPAPSKTLQERATEQCGQYQSQSSGGYTLSTNGWGEAAGTGSQCSEIDSSSGTTISWDTTWSWSGTDTQVKTYANVQANTYTKKQLSAYKSMATTWNWAYTGTNLSCNGELIHPATALQDLRDVDAGYGVDRKVRHHITSFSERLPFHGRGDLLNFYTYLEQNYKTNGFNSSLYLQEIQAGSEVFDGSNAKLATSAYSIVLT
ncbi:hypothetical protein LTR65_004933 [Meristemomyces frigidus]